MSTLYQDIIAGKTKDLEETQELKQKAEALIEGEKKQWEDWSNGIWTLEFLRRLEIIIEELDVKIDAYLRRDLDRERALFVATEQNTLKRVIQLVKTGQYEPKGNILYK